jgi:hypothetical protein
MGLVGDRTRAIKKGPAPAKGPGRVSIRDTCFYSSFSVRTTCERPLSKTRG